MSKEGSDRGLILLFGVFFAFALLRAFLVINIGAWMLLLLPTIGLPVYFYGRMFYLALTEKADAQPPAADEVQRQLKSGERENNVIAVVFFVLPLIFLIFVWLNRASNPPQNHQMATPSGNFVATVSRSKSTSSNNAILSNNAPIAPPPEYRQFQGTIIMWYEQLLTERQQLNTKDLTAVHVFNAHVAAYNVALKTQGQPAGEH